MKTYIADFFVEDDAFGQRFEIIRAKNFLHACIKLRKILPPHCKVYGLRESKWKKRWFC